MTNNLLLAFALMLVLEGLLPFVAPSACDGDIRKYNLDHEGPQI